MRIFFFYFEHWWCGDDDDYLLFIGTVLLLQLLLLLLELVPCNEGRELVHCRQFVNSHASGGGVTKTRYNFCYYINHWSCVHWPIGHGGTMSVLGSKIFLKQWLSISLSPVRRDTATIAPCSAPQQEGQQPSVVTTGLFTLRRGARLGEINDGQLWTIAYLHEQ